MLSILIDIIKVIILFQLLSSGHRGEVMSMLFSEDRDTSSQDQKTEVFVFGIARLEKP